jgi:hypothetical protein
MCRRKARSLDARSLRAPQQVGRTLTARLGSARRMRAVAGWPEMPRPAPKPRERRGGARHLGLFPRRHGGPHLSSLASDGRFVRATAPPRDCERVRNSASSSASLTSTRTTSSSIFIGRPALKGSRVIPDCLTSHRGAP